MSGEGVVHAGEHVDEMVRRTPEVDDVRRRYADVGLCRKALQPQRSPVGPVEIVRP